VTNRNATPPRCAALQWHVPAILIVLIGFCQAVPPALAAPGTGLILYGPTPSATPTPTSTPAPSPTEPVYISPIIVDNPQAEVTGTWTTGTSSSDKYGSDYRFSAQGDGSAYMIFRPTLPVTGPYEVSEWHPAGTNRTSAAEIVVASVDGLATLTLSQKTNGGKWNSLGIFTLAAGTTCFAKVTNHHPDAAVVMGDAFRFAFQNTAPTPTPSLSPTPTETPSGQARPFGEYVQAVIDELEARKANDVSGYLMKDLYGKYTGVTQTLWYKGTSYMWNECAKGEAVDFSGTIYYPYGHSYCSGLTLEIFHRAMKKRDLDLGIAEANENWNGIGTKGIFIIKKLWNVIVIKYSDTGLVVSSRPSPATALEMSGLGRIITYGDSTKFEDVKKYDFCDISRSTGTGHSVVFINWIRATDDNRIIGLRYYSSQGSTNGQGYSEEYFSGEGGSVVKSYFHAGRVYDQPYEWTTNTIREAGYTQ